METSFLNTENIARSTPDVERHPLRPFLPENAKVLFLGSFPPQRKRWSMDFFYPNFINDHWRIQGQVFFADRNHFVDLPARCFKLEQVAHFCREKGFAYFDAATAIRRTKDNAADQFLEVVEATDIAALASKLPCLRVIVTTGQKATDTICTTLRIAHAPSVNEQVEVADLHNADGTPVVLYRLPSSSRAYPLAFNKKVEAYRQMFRTFGIE